MKLPKCARPFWSCVWPSGVGLSSWCPSRPSSFGPSSWQSSWPTSSWRHVSSWPQSLLHKKVQVIPRLTHHLKLTADFTQRKTSYRSAVAPGNSHSKRALGINNWSLIDCCWNARKPMSLVGSCTNLWRLCNMFSAKILPCAKFFPRRACSKRHRFVHRRVEGCDLARRCAAQ